MSLETTAMRWLAWEKKCHAVMFQRTPSTLGNPDVLGITRARHLIEIEIKRTLADFKVNAAKFHVRNRAHFLPRWPRQFYYFVPFKLKDKCKAILPPWAGLATTDEEHELNFIVVVTAPINPEAEKLTTKQCVKAFHLLSNQLVSCETNLESWKRRFKDGHQPWREDYQI